MPQDSAQDSAQDAGQAARQDVEQNAELFEAHRLALEDHQDILEKHYGHVDDEQDSVSGRRRKRRSALNSSDSRIKTISLVDEDGVLFWRDDVWATDEPGDLGMGLSRRRRRRRAGLSEPSDPDPAMKQPLIWSKSFPVLKPNEIIKAIGKIDLSLNPALQDDQFGSLRSRLRPLMNVDGKWILGDIDSHGPFAGHTLLFVHGTFSNATNMLGEFAKTDDGKAFLNSAIQGYKQVLFFDHATLAVSPVMNALELGRAFADSSGRIDVIAHSRGGLVVRWWLEAFGKSLAVSDPVRAVLVGSPLNGTSLAAPDKLKNVLSLISNIGSYAATTLNLTGAANPFLWVAGSLSQIVASVAGTLANTPIVDSAVAIIPGLAGQSAVINNHEIVRLRQGPCVVSPSYYAVQSNFETDEVGWKFWKYFRADKIADIATNHIFPGDNDLVVDTDFMIDFGVPNLKLAANPLKFGIADKVWHCNYFRQPRTIDFIKATFG
jgi:hypothetical protein